ncbi:NADPH oxidase respiratory burst oxidase [Gracilaria domingensis]|nr:NADPH oxidase respiratory burst oxidase [Gracilaria domingensis]
MDDDADGDDVPNDNVQHWEGLVERQSIGDRGITKLCEKQTSSQQNNQGGVEIEDVAGATSYTNDIAHDRASRNVGGEFDFAAEAPQEHEQVDGAIEDEEKVQEGVCGQVGLHASEEARDALAHGRVRMSGGWL